MQPKDERNLRRFRIPIYEDMTLSVIEEDGYLFECGLLVYDHVKHETDVVDLCRIRTLADLFNVMSRLKAHDYSDFPEYEARLSARAQEMTNQVYAMGGGAD